MRAGAEEKRKQPRSSRSLRSARAGAEEKKDDPAASAEKIPCDIAVGDVFLAAGQSNMGLRSRYGRAKPSGCKDTKYCGSPYRVRTPAFFDQAEPQVLRAYVSGRQSICDAAAAPAFSARVFKLAVGLSVSRKAKRPAAYALLLEDFQNLDQFHFLLVAEGGDFVQHFVV